MSKGRPIPGFTVNRDGSIILDSTVISLLRKYRQDTNYLNAGDVKVLMHLLRRDYGFFINYKKIYRLCMESNLLLPRNKKKFNINRRVTQNRKINSPDKLWQFDIKTGYNCKANDLKVTIEEAMKKHKPNLESLVLRSDNAPQMTSNQLYHNLDDRVLEHEFIEVYKPSRIHKVVYG